MQEYKDYTKIEKAKFEANIKIRESKDCAETARIYYEELVKAYWWAASNALNVTVSKEAFIAEIRKVGRYPSSPDEPMLTYAEYINNWLGANACILPNSEYLTKEVLQCMAEKYNARIQPNTYLPEGYSCYLRSLWRKGKDA